MTSSEASSPTRGEAGRRGDDVRSDLYAALVPRSEGGIRIDLSSKVDAYYEDSIRQQAS